MSDIGLVFRKIIGMQSMAKKDKEMDLEKHSDLEPNPGQRVMPFQQGKQKNCFFKKKKRKEEKIKLN